MFWPIMLGQTLNTLSEPTGVAYNANWLYLDTFPSMQYAPPLPQGSSTPGKTVLPWRQVNVLATYTAAGHEYTLSEHTAVVDGVDWLYLDTLSPMEDAVPWTTRLFDIWKTMNGSHNSSHFCWIKPWLYIHLEPTIVVQTA